MIRKAFRWLLYLDLFEDMERKLHEMEVVRDAYRDNARSLAEENLRAQKTIALQRSLIGILRDVNRDLDERNVSLEKTAMEGVA